MAKAEQFTYTSILLYLKKMYLIYKENLWQMNRE